MGPALEAMDTRLSLSVPPPQAWVSHAMQFPAQLTQDACRNSPRELRLICTYFLTDYFFQVRALVGLAGWAPAPSWGHCGHPCHQRASRQGPAPAGTSPSCTRPLPLLGLGMRRTVGRPTYK